MEKPGKILRSLGLAAGMLAGEGVMDAQAPKPAEAKQTQENRETNPLNPTQELNRLLKEYAPKDGAEKWLSASESQRKSAQKEGLDTDLGKTFIRRAEIWGLKYKLFTQLKREIEYWEKHIQNPEDQSLRIQGFKIGGETNLILDSIQDLTERAERFGRLDPDDMEWRYARQELQAQDFDRQMEKFLREMRAYYRSKGGKVNLDPPPELRRRPR